MSQRSSGYERKERDAYQTPAWVTRALIERVTPGIFRKGAFVWEPAAGKGQMVAELEAAGFLVYASDIEPEAEQCSRCDFLRERITLKPDVICTNPPYVDAVPFVERALEITRETNGAVAMLLNVDWDSGKTRRHLFRDCPAFARKIVLIDRVVWFEPPPGSKKSSPSDNHAWFVWDWLNRGRPPTLDWADNPSKKRTAVASKRGDAGRRSHSEIPALELLK